MIKFYHFDNRLRMTNEEITDSYIDEKQLLAIFAENLRELRTHCGFSLVELSGCLDIPNQTLSSYENKTHTPSMIQAIKIASYFGLSIEEFILCGFDDYAYDIVEVYEKNRKEL